MLCTQARTRVYLVHDGIADCGKQYYVRKQELEFTWYMMALLTVVNNIMYASKN